MRVIVATFEGVVVKVCENWDAYDQWIESQERYDKDSVQSSDAHVREEK